MKKETTVASKNSDLGSYQNEYKNAKEKKENSRAINQ